jgi:O-antigen/teichoic acid export membrane protein
MLHCWGQMHPRSRLLVGRKECLCTMTPTPAPIPDRVSAAPSIRPPLRGAVWTIGAYVVNQALRVVTSVVLARLLAPELFGTMLIVYTLAIGFQLISDVGIGQNIIYNKNAENPDFYNTAWTLQLIRSVVLWLVFVAAAVPIAHFYKSPILAFVVPITAFTFVLGGLTSISKALLNKRLRFAKLNAFETIVSFVSTAGQILLAYISPTIWALAFGNLFSAAVTMAGSYFLLPDVTQRLHLSKSIVREILTFGKWIFISSIVYFLSVNYDKLYLGTVVPFQILGIYGIARAIADLSSNLVLRLGSVVVFPFIASHSEAPRTDLRKQLAPIRLKSMMLAAVGFSLFVVGADLIIKILYDKRYQEASWMLPVLISGSWFSVLSHLNESTLLGLGKPSYGALSNGSKFVFLLIGLPVSARISGVFGCVTVIALSDLFRYFPILFGQKKEQFSFGTQDSLTTLAVIFMIGLLEWLRWLLGFGTSFDSMPIAWNYF